MVIVKRHLRKIKGNSVSGKNIIYPSVEEIINANIRALELKKVSKAERAKLDKSPLVLEKIIENAKNKDGDVISKASIFLHDINRQHPFASANKRTSWIVAMEFILNNKGAIQLKRYEDVDFLYDIREGKKSLEEIEAWLR